MFGHFYRIIIYKPVSLKAPETRKIVSTSNSFSLNVSVLYIIINVDLLIYPTECVVDRFYNVVCVVVILAIDDCNIEQNVHRE